MPKKILALILAIIMVICTVSCANSGTQEKSTDAGTSPSSDGEVTAKEDEGEKLELPDKKFNDKTLTFLVRASGGEWDTIDIYAEGITGDIINDAVYRRNDIILSDYGVTILEIGTDSTAQMVESEVKTHSGEFQAVISKLGDAATISNKGQLYDLNSSEIQYIDLEKSWWDSKAANELSINGGLYFATGDLLTSDNDGTFILMFNKTIAKNKNMPNLYESVAKYEWTYDLMYSLEQQAIEDVNGELKYDEGIIGFAVTGNVPYCAFYSAGIRLVNKDNNDYPSYSLDIEKATRIIEASAPVFGKDVALNMEIDGDGNVVTSGTKCFGGGHALFFGECMQCISRLRESDAIFGVLPYPMLNKDQKAYYAHMNEVGGVMSIVKSNSDATLEMTCIVIEAMAYHSQKLLTPAYYDKSLVYKGLHDEESKPMLDLILANRVYDLAYIYGWGGAVAGIRQMIADGRNTISSQSARYKTQVNNAIKRMIKQMERD